MPDQNTTTLSLSLLDVYGNPIKDRVDISLRHTVLMSAVFSLKNQDGSKRLSIKGLDFTQGGRYEMFIGGLKYGTVHQFVQVSEDEETELELTFPVRANKVRGISAPGYASLGDDLRLVLQNSEVESFPGLRGPDLYGALDDVRKAGLLNIYAKMRATVFRLPDPRDTFSYVTALTRLRGDRFFAEVKKELRDEVKNAQSSQLFHSVPGGMHTPPPGYVLVDSYKTLERYGNLQITFFNNPATLDFLADIDIDDAQGIEHIFQVVDHMVTGNETNPYDIHEILLGYQKLDPGYTLLI
ncbi:MAG TPA: hypothetical protein VFA21_06735 [Pyrinomonadaceae bacterium]|nr:hypothetical protein [Pyrinomonadaceae bacterium]